MDEPSAISSDALDDIAYLARSENRVRILEALATGAYHRRELGEVTETSRTTLGRILSELEERDWIERTTEGDYRATPRGQHVAGEFRPFLDGMEAIRKLGEMVAWLPPDELSIGLQHFSDATIKRPEANAPIDADRYLAELLRDATEFYTLTYLAPPITVGNAMREEVTAGRLSAEHVCAGGLVDYLRAHPDGPPPWREYIESGARVYRYDGHIPCNLFVVNETVLVENSQANNRNIGSVIESQNDTVRTWALDLIETYRERSEQIDAESFPQGSTSKG